MVADNWVSRWKQNRKVIWSGSSVGGGGGVKENHPFKTFFLCDASFAPLRNVSYSSRPILSVLRLCLASIFLWFAIERRICSHNGGKNLCFVKGEWHGNEPVFNEIILNVEGKFTFSHFLRFVDSRLRKVKSLTIELIWIWKEVIIVLV